jgi:hypothetical protein
MYEEQMKLAEMGGIYFNMSSVLIAANLDGSNYGVKIG